MRSRFKGHSGYMIVATNTPRLLSFGCSLTFTTRGELPDRFEIDASYDLTRTTLARCLLAAYLYGGALSSKGALEWA